MEDNEITSKIIKSAIEVHKILGPGLLERTYEKCLVYELKSIGIKVQNQVLLPLVYKGIKLKSGYRIDLLVEDRIIVEIKSVEYLHNIHMAQILTYLKLKNLRHGLLLNFNNQTLIDGIKRVRNGYD
jgi:GxxExxY protein